MRKVTKIELTEAYERHSRVVRLDWRQCVGATEQARCIEHMQRTGADLMEVLNRPMRATVPQDLVHSAESMIDRSFHIISAHLGHGLGA